MILEILSGLGSVENIREPDFFQDVKSGDHVVGVISPRLQAFVVLAYRQVDLVEEKVIRFALLNSAISGSVSVSPEVLRERDRLIQEVEVGKAQLDLLFAILFQEVKEEFSAASLSAFAIRRGWAVVAVGKSDVAEPVPITDPYPEKLAGYHFHRGKKSNTVH